MELTKKELEAMNVLWSSDRPLAKSEIAMLCNNRSWKDSYTHLLISGLIKKGAIIEAGVKKVGKTWASIYKENISCEEYYANNVFSGSSKEVLLFIFRALLNAGKLDWEFITELENILEKSKENLYNPCS